MYKENHILLSLMRQPQSCVVGSFDVASPTTPLNISNRDLQNLKGELPMISSIREGGAARLIPAYTHGAYSWLWARLVLVSLPKLIL
jgi:hypothetical protein